MAVYYYAKKMRQSSIGGNVIIPPAPISSTSSSTSSSSNAAAKNNSLSSAAALPAVPSVITKVLPSASFPFLLCPISKWLTGLYVLMLVSGFGETAIGLPTRIYQNSTEIVLMFFLMIEPTGMTTAAP
jgi:hypothetical protein